MDEVIVNYDEMNGEVRLVRLAIVMVIIVVAFIAVVRVWIKDNYMERLSQQQTCISMGGDWVVWANECENPTVSMELFSQTCTSSEGVFYECQSPCRNTLNGSVRSYSCIESCVAVCHYQ